MELNMTTDQIFDTIESIAATPGKNDKISMLKAVAGCELLKRVLAATYNPLISYGIKKVPDRTVTIDAGRDFTNGTWSILEEMRNRTLTGHAMHAAVQEELNLLTPKSAELFKRIILKDMRAGFSEETCNKVWPSLVPDFPYMRCALPKDAKFDEWDWSQGHISQEKADGMFANLDVESDGQVFIYSRQGTQFPMEKFEELAKAAGAIFRRESQNHGEVLVLRDGVVLPRQTGNGILNSVLKGGDFGPNEQPIFMVWDQIGLASVTSKGKYVVPYADRLKGLIEQIRTAAGNDCIRLIPTRIVKSLKEAYAHAAEIMLAGGEGTILKKRTAHWKDGTSKEQIKLKLEFEVDLQVKEIVMGRLNTKNAGRAGSLKCATSDGLLVVDVAVKNEAMRDSVDANPSDWIGRIMPVTANLVQLPSESNDLHTLFLPRFSQPVYRTDKTVADTLERVLEQEEAAKGTRKEAEKEAA